MRRLTLALLSGALLAASLVAAAAAAPRIETGAELVSACEAFVKLDERSSQNAVHPHHCHQYLVGYFSAFSEGERAARDSRASGMQSGAPSRSCVHLPDYVSFRDMAARIVAHAKREPSTLTEPAAILVRRTLENDFPCAPGEHKPNR